MVWKGVWDHPFQIIPPSNLGLPVIQGSKIPPFQSLSIKYMTPWNSPNSEMDNAHIWIGSTMQTNRKQNASNREDFEQ